MTPALNPKLPIPIDRAVQVAEGDLVRIRMVIGPTNSLVNWNELTY